MGNMLRNFISDGGQFVITDVKPVNELEGTMTMATVQYSMKVVWLP
jgi:hypothetical protein